MVRGKLYIFTRLVLLGRYIGMEVFSREPNKGVGESEFGSGSGHSNFFWSRKARYILDWLIDRLFYRSSDRTISSIVSTRVWVWVCCGCPWVETRKPYEWAVYGLTQPLLAPICTTVSQHSLPIPSVNVPWEQERQLLAELQDEEVKSCFPAEVQGRKGGYKTDFIQALYV